MSWIDGVSDLKAAIRNDMESNSTYLKTPESGKKKSYLLRSALPTAELKEFSGKMKKQYNWLSSDGKILTTSETLALKILEAIEEVKEKIVADNSTDVVVEIAREGIGSDTVWFVSVRAGV